jgi:hypothetical protein
LGDDLRSSFSSPFGRDVELLALGHEDLLTDLDVLLHSLSVELPPTVLAFFSIIIARAFCSFNLIEVVARSAFVSRVSVVVRTPWLFFSDWRRLVVIFILVVVYRASRLFLDCLWGLVVFLLHPSVVGRPPRLLLSDWRSLIVLLLLDRDLFSLRFEGFAVVPWSLGDTDLKFREVRRRLSPHLSLQQLQTTAGFSQLILADWFRRPKSLSFTSHISKKRRTKLLTWLRATHPLVPDCLPL